MLKYEHVSRGIYDIDAQEFVSRIIESGCACRVTTTYTNGLPDILYYYNNDYHRTDGPAYIDYEGGKGSIGFWLNGIAYFSTKQYCEAAGMSKEDTLMWALRFGDDLPWTIEDYYGENWESIPMDQL